MLGAWVVSSGEFCCMALYLAGLQRTLLSPGLLVPVRLGTYQALWLRHSGNSHIIRWDSLSTRI